MNTTFILHGGNAHHRNNENEKFFQEIMKSFDLRLTTVLLVYFALENEDYERKRIEDEEMFRKATPNFVQFEVACEEMLEEQIRESNVIYLHGGNTRRLLNTLKKYPKLIEWLEDKVVAGESAGSYVLSKHFYSKSMGGTYKGLGFVPATTICHYEGENEEKLDGVLEKDPELEKLLLKDGEYRVF